MILNDINVCAYIHYSTKPGSVYEEVVEFIVTLLAVIRVELTE